MSKKFYKKILLSTYLMFGSTVSSLAEDIPGLPQLCDVGVVDNSAFVQTVGRATSISADPHSDSAAIDEASREALQLCATALEHAMASQSAEAAAFRRTCRRSGLCVAADDDVSHPCRVVPFTLQVTPITMDLGAQGSVTAFVVSVIAQGVADISNYSCSARDNSEPMFN